ncbi:hypothetical protein ABDK00_013200 [Niabella insulamsoli]
MEKEISPLMQAYLQEIKKEDTKKDVPIPENVSAMMKQYLTTKK